MRKSRKVILGSLATTAAITLTAHSPITLANTDADTMTDKTTIGEWEIGLTIYGWAKSVDGTSSGRDVELDFKDQIVDLLDGVFMGKIEAESGPLMVFAAYEYTRLYTDDNDVSVSVDVPTNLPRPLPPTLPADITSNVDVTDTQHMWELGAAWKVYDSHSFNFMLEGGLRYYDYELKLYIDPVTVSVTPPGGGDPIVRSFPQENRTTAGEWLQPFIGFRANYHFFDNWRLEGRFDYGNNPFDDSDSNNSWMAEALLNWRFVDWGALQAGYRYADMDYDNGKDNSHAFSWVMKEFGPIIGFTFIF